MSWQSRLRPASYNGVSFYVVGGTSQFGRRQAVHEYPFRDIPWVEDLGRAARRFTVTGFLLGDNVQDDRDVLISAAESAGIGTLVHPTYGFLKVSLSALQIEEAWDKGRVFALRMTFVEEGLQVYPTKYASTQEAGQSLVAPTFLSTALGYYAQVKGLIALGQSVIKQAELTVESYLRTASNFVNSAESLYNSLVQLPGTVEGLFGRYFGGNTLSGLVTNASTTSNATVDSLIALTTVNFLAVSAAQAAMVAASSSTNPNDLSTASQNYITACAATAQNPRDALTILANMAQFTPTVYTTSAPIGVAVNTVNDSIGDMVRRNALIALAQAVFTYQPSSFDDANNVLQLVCGLLDAEIDIAGDEGEDDVFLAMRALRTAVALDLNTRGASLAPIATFTSKASLPASVWAYRIYQDASRTDQLITQANPPHPAFMPLSFKALSA